MPKLVWLNGVVSPLESAVVSAADHAHLYGDGLFEGIRIYSGRIFKLDEHLDRLYHGIRYFGYEMEMPQSAMRATILDVCNQAGITEGYIRLNVTRGTGLGLDPKNINRIPNVMIMVNELALYPPSAYETGLEVITSSYRVMTSDTIEPRVKCIGKYASNIMAKQEANRQGAGEAMMLNSRGEIAECSGDNMFLIQGRTIRTPHPSCGILKGVTRDTAIELARGAGYTVVEDFLTPFDVFASDEAFLTGTAAEIIGMVSLDGRLIGDGKPGPVTRELMALYAQVRVTGVPFQSVAATTS